jgi:hypothetical protein
MIFEITVLLLKLFFVGFLVNLVWEVNHSVLYSTCYKLSLPQYTRLITIMSAKDGLWISLFYGISATLFQNIYILENFGQLIIFILLSLSFSFFDEKISVKMGRWEYRKAMPVIFGVGLIPLLEIAVTGTFTFFLVFIVF